MARKPYDKDATQLADIDPGEYMSDDEIRITVVREIVVAQIHHDPNGDQSMMDAAFQAAGRAVCDNLREGQPDRVRFFYGKHHFTITAEPMA